MRTVFLSSTARDLQRFRDAVYESLSKLEGWKCIRMEAFTSKPDVNALERCRRLAASSDLYVGLLGHLYGSVPPGEDTSFTEQEYEAAGKNRLIFLAPEKFPVAAELLLKQSKKSARQQAAFRRKATLSNMSGRPESFDSPEKLAADVVAALHNWEKEHPLERQSEAVGIKLGVDPAMLSSLSVFKDQGELWCPAMTILPSGEFLMGSSDEDVDAYPEEYPQHQVVIGYRFAIGRYPITFDEYDFFCKETSRSFPYDQEWGRGRRPVINVCWSDAVEYAKWLSNKTGHTYRLPTESEWEYACRAGKSTRYCFGNYLTHKHANFGHTESGAGYALARTSIVGSFPANPWGLYDMHGNVWEHVQDVYHGNYVGAPDDGSAWLLGGVEGDRVVRGGSFSYEAKDNRAAVRCYHAMDTPDIQHGFRIVRQL